MNWRLPPAFVCPQCRAAWRVDGEARAAVLGCTACGLTAPLLRGLPLLPEARLAPERWRRDELADLDTTIFGLPGVYERFLRGKRRRPTHDLYAAFHPFNEATRSWLPLLPIIRRHVPAGSLILDLWCRTGWTGEWLAGLFPDCHVVAIWESNADTLGYRGFEHWLGLGKRSANLDFVFCDVNQALPFADASVGFVFSMDALHRYNFPHFPREVMRVARPTAPIVFAHTHFTNGKPDPFFERGEDQRSGRFYQDFFAAEQGLGKRDVYVLPELGMFVGENTRLTTDPESRHYNGMVALLPKGEAAAALAAIDHQAPPQANQRLLLHPLVEVDLQRGWLRLNESGLDEGVAHMLYRHPIQRRLLSAVLPYRLSGQQCQALFWARQGLSVAEIAARMGSAHNALAAELQPLIEGGLLLAVTASEAMLRLQTYYVEQVAEPSWREQTLAQLWANAVSAYADNIYLIDDTRSETYSYRDVDQIVADIAAALAASGLKRGDSIAVWTQPNVETYLLFWAAMRLGLVFTPIDPGRDAAYAQAILAETQAKLAFAERRRRLPTAATSTIVYFDDGAAALGDRLFGDWLERAGDGVAIIAPPPEPDDPAVVLFTSGTTGAPKGVKLSQASLFRSSRALADTFELASGDRLLCPAPLHAMSSLRNPLVVTVQVGAAAVIGDSETLTSPLAIAAAIERHGVTVLSTVPALLDRWVDAQNRIPPEQVRSLRALWTTAFRLAPATATTLAARYNCKVIDYYGLTESGGICAWRNIQEDSRNNSIGKPLDAILQVVAAHGQILDAGHVGELRLASGNLMLGYVGAASNGLQVRGGWLYSGDLAEWSADGAVLLLGRKRAMVKLKSGDVLNLDDVGDWLRRELGRDCVLRSCRTADGREAYAAFVAGAANLDDATIAERVEAAFGKTAAAAAIFWTNGDHNLQNEAWQQKSLESRQLRQP